MSRQLERAKGTNKLSAFAAGCLVIIIAIFFAAHNKAMRCSVRFVMRTVDD